MRTKTPPGSEGTNAIRSGANSITVVNRSEFADGDNIVSYDPSFRVSELNTVSGTPTSTSIPIEMAADVAKIGISLEMVDPNDTTAGVIDFKSDIVLRNLG